MRGGRFLLVGDVHADHRDLEDCGRLAQLIVDESRRAGARPIFLGDQYDGGDTVHLDVVAFWRDLLGQLQDPVALVGNHDGPYDDPLRISAMHAHRDQCQVVDEPTNLYGIGLVPFMRQPGALRRAGEVFRDFGVRELLCHAEFSGARYDNGLPVRGADERVEGIRYVSGHLHAPQRVGDCWWIGAPRWRTRVDAGHDRHLWVVDFLDGRVVPLESIPTDRSCRRVHCVVDRHGAEPDLPVIQERDRVHVEVLGPRDWVLERSRRYEDRGWSVRGVLDNEPSPEVKESDGIERSFEQWLEKYRPSGVDREPVVDLVRSRVRSATSSSSSGTSLP